MSGGGSTPLWTPSLEALDRLDVDDLVLGLFTDVRPLPGVAGLVDWRLCGTLSRFVRAGRLRGERGERVLMPGAGRVGATRLLVFGLGARERYAERAVELASEVPGVVEDAASRRVVIALPGPSRTVGKAIERMAQSLGSRLVGVFDHDGKLGDWFEGNRSTGGG